MAEQAFGEFLYPSWPRRKTKGKGGLVDQDGLRGRIREFIRRRRSKIARQVHIETSLVDGKPETRAKIDDRTNWDGSGPVEILITTSRNELEPPAFAPHEAESINTAAGKWRDPGSGKRRRADKGRAIYLVHLASEEVMAALAWHLPSRPGPLEILRIAMRQEEDRQKLSALAALILKVYVHEVSRRCDRGGRRGVSTCATVARPTACGRNSTPVRRVHLQDPLEVQARARLRPTPRAATCSGAIRGVMSASARSEANPGDSTAASVSFWPC
jgi:hypothetical protein